MHVPSTLNKYKRISTARTYSCLRRLSNRWHSYSRAWCWYSNLSISFLGSQRCACDAWLLSFVTINCCLYRLYLVWASMKARKAASAFSCLQFNLQRTEPSHSEHLGSSLLWAIYRSKWQTKAKPNITCKTPFLLAT